MDWVYYKGSGHVRLLAQFLSNCGCEQAGPGALLGFTVDSLSYTSDSVIPISFNVQITLGKSMGTENGSSLIKTD